MLARIRFVVQVLPQIVLAVQLVDDLLDKSVAGARKKEVALQLLQRFGVPDKYMSLAGNLIDLVVSALHAFGVLVRKDGLDDVIVDASEAVVQAKSVTSDQELQDFIASTD